VKRDAFVIMLEFGKPIVVCGDAMPPFDFTFQQLQLRFFQGVLKFEGLDLGSDELKVVIFVRIPNSIIICTLPVMQGRP